MDDLEKKLKNIGFSEEEALVYMEMEDEELVKLAEVGKEKIGEEEEKELKAIKRKHKVQ